MTTIDAGEVNEMSYEIRDGQMIGDYKVTEIVMGGAPVRFETLALVNPAIGTFEARTDINQLGWVWQEVFSEAIAEGYDAIHAIDAVLPVHLEVKWVSEPIFDDPEYDIGYVLSTGNVRMADETRAIEINRRLGIG